MTTTQYSPATAHMILAAETLDVCFCEDCMACDCPECSGVPDNDDETAFQAYLAAIAEEERPLSEFMYGEPTEADYHDEW